jgi:hypothetical protein
MLCLVRTSFSKLGQFRSGYFRLFQVRSCYVRLVQVSRLGHVRPG